ncbi:LysR family transcriptional regulator [Sinorhizobium meliloti]|nr:LysR family transcriptional regulator [Sinorhizobium meliloti]WQP08857.1 LysR family transcriptional regulator [Sinorhizobium meliloti]
MPINPNLNSLAYFEAVARTGRVSLAAAELGVSAAAVSQQLKQLEEQWGVRLFRRKDRRLSLTIDGELLFQTTTSAFRMISRRPLGSSAPAQQPSADDALQPQFRGPLAYTAPQELP